MDFISAQYLGIREEKVLSEQLSLQGKALDNNWLQEQVTAGFITQVCFDELQAMKSELQLIYPDLWDITTTVKKATFNETFRRDPEHFDAPYGVYFGYEDFDEEEYLTIDYDAEYNSETQDIRTEILLYTFNIVIKYPFVTITNSKGLSHNVTNLYLRIDYSLNFSDVKPLNRDYPLRVGYVEMHHMQVKKEGHRIESYMQGCRDTVTTVEFKSGYAHSHLQNREKSANGFTTFGSCCLGLGEIIQTFSMLRSGFDVNLFILLLLQMDAYTKWESLEGAPHIKMSSVIGGKPLPGYPTVKEDYCMNYYNTLTNKLKNELSVNLDYSPEVKWKIEDGLMKVIDDEAFGEFCKIYPNFSTYDSSHAFIFDDEGKIYNKNVLTYSNTVIPRVDDINSYGVVFRGEIRRLTIIPVESVQVNTSYYVINPMIRNYIKQKLESHVNYNKIKRDTARRANKALSLSANI